MRFSTLIKGSIVLACTAVLASCSSAEAPAPSQAPGTSPAATVAAAPAPSSAELVADGEILYESSCSACHGEDAMGVEGLGKDLVNSEFTQGISDSELLTFVKIGRGSGDPLNTTGIDMPAKGGNPALSDNDMKAIIAFMRSIEQ